jgi:hypothetical protein
MKPLFLVFILCATLGCKNEKSQNEERVSNLLKILNYSDKGMPNSFEFESCGDPNVPSMKYFAFDSLTKTCDCNTILKLYADQKDLVVKAYMYYGLLLKKCNGVNHIDSADQDSLSIYVCESDMILKKNTKHF